MGQFRIRIKNTKSYPNTYKIIDFGHHKCFLSDFERKFKFSADIPFFFPFPRFRDGLSFESKETFKIYLMKFL